MKLGKRKATAIAGLIAGLSLSADSLYASIPAMAHKCPQGLPSIVNPSNGSGVVFDEKCQTAFVLPPQTGEASLRTVARNANLQFCPAVLQSGATAESLTRSAARIASTLENMIEEFRPMQAQLNAAQLERSNAEAQVRELQGRVQLAEDELLQIRADLLSANNQLENCQLFGVADCSDLQEQRRNLQVQFAEQRTQLTSLQHQVLTAEGRLSRARAREQQITHAYTDGIAPLMNLYTQIETINESVMRLYQRWAPIEGATAQILYKVDWASLVEDYRRLNTNVVSSGVSFHPVPIVDGRFFATSKSASDSAALASLPAVLSAVIPGAEPYGPNHLDGGNMSINPSYNDYSNVSSHSLNEEMLRFSSGAQGGGTSVSGQVVLSLMGACPYFPAGVQSPNRTTINQRELTAHMVVNAALYYDVKVHRAYKANFNLSNLVSRMEKMTEQRRWFFTSKNAHDLIIDENHSSWFKIEFDTSSSDFQFTPEEQMEITREVKADLVQRALDNIGTIAGQAPALPGLGKTGFENQPTKLRCNKLFCHGYAYILAIADGFFGSKTAVSNFKQSNRAWVGDDVKQTKVLRRSHVLTFTPEN